MLKNIFVSEVRVNILKLFLLNPGSSYHVRAIVRAVSAEINAVRRELLNLYKLNFLTKRQSSNRLYYTVNILHPYYPELVSLMEKEAGLGAEIIKSLEKLGEVEFAMISKAYVRGRESTALDVDLFLVGNIRTDVLGTIIRGEEAKNKREINFSIMKSDEFKSRKRTHDQFMTRLLNQSRIMLCGDEEKFYSII